MSLSPELLALVQAQEGCRLDAYLDAVGVWTIGWGQTGPDIGPHTTWTPEQCDARLAQSLAHYQAGVTALCPRVPDGPRHDALTDFAYNLGLGALEHSTLRARVLADDWAGAAHECLKWNHAGGKVLHGLTVRRGIEARWLATNTYTTQEAA
jgi:lysozyme